MAGTVIKLPGLPPIPVPSKLPPPPGLGPIKKIGKKRKAKARNEGLMIAAIVLVAALWFERRYPPAPYRNVIDV